MSLRLAIKSLADEILDSRVHEDTKCDVSSDAKLAVVLWTDCQACVDVVAGNQCISRDRDESCAQYGGTCEARQQEQ